MGGEENRLLIYIFSQGDAVFHAPRRFFQQALSGKQNQWAYRASLLL
jgi:hypothetical protein